MDKALKRSAFAGFSRRLAAGVIDWLIVLAALWLAFVIRAALGDDGGVISAVLTVASLLLPTVYFASFWARSGQTPGMRTTEIQLVDARTFGPPTSKPAALRGLVATITFVASWLPFVVAFSDAPEDTSQAVALAAVGVAIAVTALIGHLWALPDALKQSLQDRLFGFVVLNAKPATEQTLVTPIKT